jgi:hypothetical protein
MQDPDPSNIYGEKRTVHSVDHIIRWDYALLAVAGLYVAYKLSGALASSSSEESESDPFTGEIEDAVDGAEVMIE